jgi:hypothetical protein
MAYFFAHYSIPQADLEALMMQARPTNLVSKRCSSKAGSKSAVGSLEVRIQPFRCRCLLIATHAG